MSQVLDKKMIVMYWFRIIYGDENVSIQDIAKIIDKFATEIEKFDPNFEPKTHQLSDNNTLITASQYGYTMAYLKCIAMDGIHRWCFEVISTSNNFFVIGVWKVKYPKPKTEYLFTSKAWDKYYGWCIYHKVLAMDDNNKDTSYGKEGCKDGDTVEMVLNLNDMHLSYIYNGESQGIAFNHIEKCGYIASIQMYNTGMSIQLLKYEGNGQTAIASTK